MLLVQDRSLDLLTSNSSALPLCYGYLLLYIISSVITEQTILQSDYHNSAYNNCLFLVQTQHSFTGVAFGLNHHSFHFHFLCESVFYKTNAIKHRRPIPFEKCSKHNQLDYQSIIDLDVSLIFCTRVVLILYSTEKIVNRFLCNTTT